MPNIGGPNGHVALLFYISIYHMRPSLKLFLFLNDKDVASVTDQ